MPKVYNNRGKRAKCAKSLKQAISYQTLPSSEELGNYPKLINNPDVIGHRSPGPNPASNPPPLPQNDDAPVNIIANAPELDIPDNADIPDEYKFELYRLRNRVTELEYIVKDKNDRISKALAMIEDELLMWKTTLYDHVSETYGQILRRIVKLEATLSYLRDKQSRYYPPLDIPARWQTGKLTEER